MKCSHVMVNIDDTYMYKGIEFLFLDSSYKVGITGIQRRGPHTRSNSSDRVQGQAGAQVGGPFHRQDEGIPQRIQARNAIR
jgi:hypothetical protein